MGGTYIPVCSCERWNHTISVVCQNEVLRLHINYGLVVVCGGSRDVCVLRDSQMLRHMQIAGG